jgi:hypothetical protein
MKKLLDIFSGTGSVGKVFRANGWEVVSVDIEPKHKPTLLVDVMTLPPTIGKGFDMIWMSPPCTEWSCAHTLSERDLDGASKIVLHCLEIIKQSKPRFWCLENPYSGLLPRQEFMRGLDYTICSYCKYSDWGYRKDTIVYNSFGLELDRCKYDCESLVKGPSGRWSHKHHAQKASKVGDGVNFTTFQLYRIPPKLIQVIYEKVMDQCA